MHYLKKKAIKEQCKIYRDKISRNLYFLHKAPDKLSGNKLIYVIRLLKHKNEILYNEIQKLQCRGRDEIYLTMEPKN